LRVRLWMDFLKHSYGDAAYWQAPAADQAPPAARQARPTT